MFDVIKTKSGDVLWIKTSENCGRREIALMMFATWERQKRREEIKTLKRNFECSG